MESEQTQLSKIDNVKKNAHETFRDIFDKVERVKDVKIKYRDSVDIIFSHVDLITIYFKLRTLTESYKELPKHNLKERDIAIGLLEEALEYFEKLLPKQFQQDKLTAELCLLSEELESLRCRKKKNKLMKTINKVLEKYHETSR